MENGLFTPWSVIELGTEEKFEKLMSVVMTEATVESVKPCSGDMTGSGTVPEQEWMCFSPNNRCMVTEGIMEESVCDIIKKNVFSYVVYTY